MVVLNTYQSLHPSSPELGNPPVGTGSGTTVPVDPVIFEPPWVRDRPPYLPESTHREIMLWRHFENRLRGVNVWQRNDGTFVQDTPSNYEIAQTHPAAWVSDDPIGPDLTAEFQNDSNVNYPWNPFPGSTNSEQPGSYAYNVNWDQTTQDFALEPFLVSWWEGGTINVITQAEALVLTAAGYGDCITGTGLPDPVVEVTAPPPSSPGFGYGGFAYGDGIYG